MKLLTDYEKQTIEALREDARSLKECYTNFAFQAIAFSAAVLGVLARYQPDYPYFGLASVATVILLLTVSRIGTHKYTSANRQYGYELHLFRTRNLADNSRDGWKSSMRDIGWEEAMRAWRIVQPSVFRHLYYAGSVIPNYLRKKYRNREYQWFDPTKLTHLNAVYYAGSYLSVMTNILYLFAVLAVVPLVFMAFQLNEDGILSLRYGQLIPEILIVYIGFKYLHERARVDVLESGLLSIHSCAIMWEAVVVAHYRALKETKGHKYYTKHLAEQANNLVFNIFDIHDWVQDQNFRKQKSTPDH